jgi:archaellum component FlaC
MFDEVGDQINLIERKKLEAKNNLRNLYKKTHNIGGPKPNTINSELSKNLTLIADLEEELNKLDEKQTVILKELKKISSTAYDISQAK